jgi:hypothetical protein
MGSYGTVHGTGTYQFYLLNHQMNGYLVLDLCTYNKFLEFKFDTRSTVANKLA